MERADVLTVGDRFPYHAGMVRTLLLCLLLVSAALAAPTLRTEAAGLRFTLPATWTRVPTAAETRAAQYQLPRATGDEAETDAALFFLGAGKGGTADEAVERWCKRFVLPDGRPSRAAAVVAKRTVKALEVTTLDLAGTYVAGDASAQRAGVSGYRMLAAVVEGPGGPWFFEILGPAATVSAAKTDFDALVASLDAHP
jgi:hypothetical protein